MHNKGFNQAAFFCISIVSPSFDMLPETKRIDSGENTAKAHTAVKPNMIEMSSKTTFL